MNQLSIFDALRTPPIIRPVDPDAGVVQGDCDEVLCFRPAKWRLAWSPCEIELHRDRESGLWMWSVKHGLMTGGSGYRVGRKWGRFAETRDAALFHAAAEAREQLAARAQRDSADTKLARQIVAWLDEVAR